MNRALAIVVTFFLGLSSAWAQLHSEPEKSIQPQSGANVGPEIKPDPKVEVSTSALQNGGQVESLQATLHNDQQISWFLGQLLSKLQRNELPGTIMLTVTSDAHEAIVNKLLKSPEYSGLKNSVILAKVIEAGGELPTASEAVAPGPVLTPILSPSHDVKINPPPAVPEKPTPEQVSDAQLGQPKGLFGEIKSLAGKGSELLLNVAIQTKQFVPYILKSAVKNPGAALVTMFSLMVPGSPILHIITLSLGHPIIGVTAGVIVGAAVLAFGLNRATWNNINEYLATRLNAKMVKWQVYGPAFAEKAEVYLELLSRFAVTGVLKGIAFGALTFEASDLFLFQHAGFTLQQNLMRAGAMSLWTAISYGLMSFHWERMVEKFETLKGHPLALVLVKGFYDIGKLASSVAMLALTARYAPEGFSPTEFISGLAWLWAGGSFVVGWATYKNFDSIASYMLSEGAVVYKYLEHTGEFFRDSFYHAFGKEGFTQFFSFAPSRSGGGLRCRAVFN